MAEVTVYPNSGVSADESRIESTHAEDFVIVDEEPLTWRRDQFPLILHAERIYGFSISNCVIATLLIMTGFASIYGVPYFTSDIAFPVWCGTMILINGIVGCVMKQTLNSCMIGLFFTLSIISLILTITMICFYAVTLEYFATLIRLVCSWQMYYGKRVYRCTVKMLRGTHEISLGLTGLLMFLLCCELVCSIAVVVLSCKAYSRFCNTGHSRDCCICKGCCQCDFAPLRVNQDGGQNSRSTKAYSSCSKPVTHGHDHDPNSGVYNYVIKVPGNTEMLGFSYGAGDGVPSFKMRVHPITTKQEFQPDQTTERILHSDGSLQDQDPL